MTLDRIDRKILTALVEDASRSYASLAEAVGLSSPAVHERVKKLKRAGVIQSVSARLHPTSLGKSTLTFVHVTVNGWGKPDVVRALERFPEVEEMHSVAGDACLILKVRTRDPADLELLLAQLYAIPSVTATKSYVVLSTLLERPVQATLTEHWPDPEL